MQKLHKPTGLIRYASENAIANNEPLRYTKRMKFYTFLCLLLLSILSFLLFTRKDIDATIMRTPGMLFQEVGKDSVSNLYNLKAVNKTVADVQLTIQLLDADGKINVIGKNYVTVNKEAQGAGTFFIVLPKKYIKQRSTHLKLGLYEGNKQIAVVKTNFLGPVGD
jgi:polyferredoxin